MKKRPAGRKTSKAAPVAASSAPRAVRIAICLALAALTLAVFAQVRSHDFVDLDDGLYVTQNTNVTTGVSFDNVWWAFTTGRAANWHPLTWISHQIDVSLFGVDPGPHHVVNLAWHLLNVLLLFELLRAMTGATWRSAIVAALFAVHPAHVESVAWVSERKDVLSTFFLLAATWSWMRWTRKPSSALFAATGVLFALGLMAKPMLMTLPFVWMLLDFWPLGRGSIPWRRRIQEKSLFLVLAVASAAITVIVQQRGGAVSGIDIVPVGHRLANAVASYGQYLRTLIWPDNLAAFYPYPTSMPIAAAAAAAVVLAAISALAWQWRRTRPYLLTGWLWFLGTMVPVIGLVQIGTQSHADRYTYVPYIGLGIGIVWLIHELTAKIRYGARAAAAVASAVILMLAAQSYAQTATWRSSEALWTHAVSVTRGNARAHNLLGAVYGNTGRVTEAEAQFKEALRLQPDLGERIHIYPNLARALMAQGKIDEAVPHFQQARTVKPQDAALASEAGFAYLGANRPDEAITAWRDAVRLDPGQEQAWFALGMTLAASGRATEARQAFGEVLRINPSRQDAAAALERLR